MSETQFYTLVTIPLVGILMNGGLFLYLAGRIDRLIEKLNELEQRVTRLEK